MNKMNYQRYKAFPKLDFPQRTWPSRVIDRAPVWCSVDLRDGNQALEIPMNLDQKLEFFQYLLDIGFKTIEIGFPAASETEFDFTRYLIENDLVPDDVAIQVLTQSRPEIIAKTFLALKGAKRAVVHLYNSTSTLQRDVVFHMNKAEVIELAVSGAKLIQDYAAQDEAGTDFIFEYSPESFTGTEMDFAVEICDAVCDVWQPTAQNKTIINLPSTVEMITPNVYADQIEYFCTHTRYRQQIEVSLHTHNDRGTGIAATELGLLAGADRVEGTLFGNGERTGNCDLMVVALNLFSQGVDPQLDFNDINKARSVYENLTRMSVHPRHPYAGDLVYTAFSGSHQDAINKGMTAIKNKSIWEVPYLPIDPVDVGRSYDPIIRINSQSGKGGVSFIMEQFFGISLSKPMAKALSARVTHESVIGNKELQPQEIYNLFINTYVNRVQPLKLESFREEMVSNTEIRVEANLIYQQKAYELQATGTGAVDALCRILEKLLDVKLSVTNYHQQAMERGTQSRALSEVQLLSQGQYYVGAGESRSVTKSSLRAVVSAVNDLLSKTPVKETALSGQA